MRDVLTIKELPAIERSILKHRVRATIERFPSLRLFYDDPFIEKLAGRPIGNHLLFLLCQDAVASDYVDRFWREVIEDLNLLSHHDAWRRFAGRFRNTTRESIESARTELDVAARLARAGRILVFDPVLENGRCPEFSVDGSTFWEIKLVLDEKKVRAANDALEELDRQLRALRLPYWINLDADSVEPDVDVTSFAKEIKRMVAALHAAGGRGPRVITAYGIRAAIGGRSATERVHVGLTEQGFVFDGTQAQRVRDVVKHAIQQLPPDGAGIVIVDATASDWLDVDTVEEACCGTEGVTFNATSYYPSREADGIFHPNRNRRLSAVVYYNRREFATSSSRYPALTAFHNRFANVSLLPETLQALGAIRQFRYVPSKPGFVKRQTL